MRGWRRAFVGILVLAAASSGGCGYSLAGRGSFLPPHIRTIGVPLFQNSTTTFEVEQVITQRVRAEFIGRGRYQVVPEAAGADAVLIGEITNISLQPTAFTPEQLVSRYNLVLTARLEFRDVRNDAIIWENSSLTFSEEYELATASPTVDPGAGFLTQDANALERVATNFAKSVVSSIMETF